jgi:subtilisin family serine protease
MTPNLVRRSAAWTVVAILAALTSVVLWRAFIARPAGRFPILSDVPVRSLPVRAPEQKIRPALKTLLHEARKVKGGLGEPVTFLVDLVDQMDLTAFGKLLDDRGERDMKARRREAFLEGLSLLAEARQASMLQALERLRRQGRVVRYDPFRVVNRVAVTARDPDVAIELARRRDVATLIEDVTPQARRTWPNPGALPPAEPAPPPMVATPGLADPHCWAIDEIGAPTAWRRGLDGRGVVVGLLDTGARGDHEQLRDNWRGFRQPTRARDSWYHPRDPQSRVPVDTAHHGTGVLAAAVGLNRPTRDGRPTMIGVAPGATWVATPAYFEGTYDHVLFTAALEWMLWHARPDVIIHTMAYSQEDADPMTPHLFSAIKAAEIVVVMAAGNGGPTRGRNLAPANLIGLYPYGIPAFSVGSSNRRGEVSAFSARGPTDQNFSDVFPQVVAPGEDLTVAFALAPDALIREEGTSFSVGYAGGAAAILLQASPDLHPNAVEWLLKKTAKAIGTPRPNHDAGWGRLDIPAALHAVDEERLAGQSPR